MTAIEVPTTDHMGRCSEHGSAMCTHPTDDPELWCTHPTGERTKRTAHGYLGDVSRGTVEELCGGCGEVLTTTAPVR